ncbi:MAG: hypothetical protein QM763_00050 [Agriterribacter sp.]
MAITSEQYEKIIRFIDAEMESAEMEAFEKELVSNPELRSQLDFEQSLRDNFSVRNITNLPGTIPANENVAIHAKPGKIKGIQKWFAVCAAVITVLLLLTIFWKKAEPAQDITITNDIDTVQKKNILPPIIEPTVAKDSSRNIDLALLFKQYFKKDALPEHYPLYLAEALMDYESGNYKTLQKLNLNDLPQTRGKDGTGDKENILQLGHYYKGMALLQTNNTKDAIINLNWVVNNQQDKALRAKALWYLSLAYLKENNAEKAVELCRSIINNKENDVLIKNAEKILDTIRK